MAKEKLRSRAYPAVPLHEAIDLLQRITTFGWEARDREALAQCLGYSSGSSGAAVRKIAALSHFGFLSLEHGRYSPTQLSRQVLLESEPAVNAAALRRACLNPALFRELIHLYKPVGRVPLHLAAALVYDHGIQENAKDEVATIFMASSVYAGILNDDGSFRDEFLQGSRTAPSFPPPQTAVVNDIQNRATVLSTLQTLRFPITDQRFVEIHLPPHLNEQDILLLRAQIDFLELQVKLNRPDQPVRLDVYRDRKRQ